MLAEITDSRRLTGANLHWDLASAILDVATHGDATKLIEQWQHSVGHLLHAVDHAEQRTFVRLFDGGCSLLISAPIDALYSMCELNEYAFEVALKQISGTDVDDYPGNCQRLTDLFSEESHPELLALQRAAADHEVPFLWDDDEVSIGYGASAKVWPADKLPSVDEVVWDRIRTIPVALVTGTNGKSTTVRMSAAILSAAGLKAGLTSTDWIRVGTKILDTGDYSGTGGARTLMRHPQTEVAILETARGGLLRRGLGVERASAALVTNVAADHLGDYGINTVPELIEAKFIVRRALDEGAPLVLNADDPGIVTFAATLDCPIVWFSLDERNQVILDHRSDNSLSVVLSGHQLTFLQGHSAEPFVTVAEIPATLNGAAKHNISNALAAAALCRVLGAENAAIRQGLQSFSGDENDNPGRCNWFEKDGVRILVDFAHNAHGMKALAEMVRSIDHSRVWLLTGQAGDRLDHDIAEMVAAACEMEPELVLACAMPGYERGRPQAEVQGVIRDTAIKAGVPAQGIINFASPAEAATFALGQAKPGDLLVFLALTQRQQVLDQVHAYISD